jgi:acyl-CoA reductase-like NAD-dependent aldehyde dehydrogenase
MSVSADATAVSGDVLKSVNPFNGETLKTFPEMTPDEVTAVIEKADCLKAERRTQTTMIVTRCGECCSV